jgi:hypothetical protein
MCSFHPFMPCIIISLPAGLMYEWHAFIYNGSVGQVVISLTSKVSISTEPYIIMYMMIIILS